MPKSKINTEEMKKVDRKPVTLEEMEEFVGQIMTHSAKPDNSEYRKPTAQEREIPWVLTRKEQKSGT